MTETKSKLSLSDAGVSYAQKVLDEMEKESDRATAILLGAELDDMLGQILEKHLLPPRAKKDSGAIAKSFYARIELTNRLGLIHPIFHHELHLIKDVRNEFAHKKLGVTFESPEVFALTSKLVFPKTADKLSKGRPELVALLHQNSRERFIFSGAILLHQLTSLQERVGRIGISPLAFH